MGQMEEMLAMLFQGRSLETKAQSDATHAPLLDQLAVQRFRPQEPSLKTKLMGVHNKTAFPGPANPPAGGVATAQEKLGDRSAQAKLKQWQGKRPIWAEPDQPAEGGLSDFDRYDTPFAPGGSPSDQAAAQAQASVNRVFPAGAAQAFSGGMHGTTPSAPAPLPRKVPVDAVEYPTAVGTPQVVAGDGSDTIYGSRDLVDPRLASPYTVAPDHGAVDPASSLTEDQRNFDDGVQTYGWLESDFQGKSHRDAAALIADQLRTRRIREMGDVAPDWWSANSISGL